MQGSISQLFTHYQKHPNICIDSRTAEPGSFFFAIKGDRFDGNVFAEDAIERGCACAVVDDEKYKKDARFILVSNALQSLQQLALYYRKNLNIPVIGITGTNGKTTTKELITAVLSEKFHVHATHGNFNNHIGVPLTILSITADTQIAVVEMGANHIGEIETLCNISLPTHGLITNIGIAHLEGFGSPKGVIKAKKELYDFISNNKGTAFVNKDNELLTKLSKSIHRVTYGTSNDVFCMGQMLSVLSFVSLNYRCGSKGAERKVINSRLFGAHNFENILAAICVGQYFEVEPSRIKKAIENYIPSNNRSQIINSGKNTIILDAYNANPMNMRAAINGFSQMETEKKMVILGDMLELGRYAYDEHSKIIDLLKNYKFDPVILVGENFLKLKDEIPCIHFSHTKEAEEWLKTHEITGMHILIKGSRGIGLEKLVPLL